MPKYDQETYEDLRASLNIARDALDEEAIMQPNHYFHASEGHVYAVARRDKRKHELEVTVAELDKDVREQMAADGEKVTEAQVKAQITREPEYHASHRKFLDACLEADKWESLRNAYRQRADMLKSLVQLHQTSYFGDVVGSAERAVARGRFDNKRGAV